MQSKANHKLAPGKAKREESLSAYSLDDFSRSAQLKFQPEKRREPQAPRGYRARLRGQE